MCYGLDDYYDNHYDYNDDMELTDTNIKYIREEFESQMDIDINNNYKQAMLDYYDINIDELKVVQFIKANKDWKEQLSKEPYFIKIKRKHNFISLEYEQTKSDFHNEIVKECRGLILEANTYKPVCIPFYKFGNYGESYVDEIDWNTARVQQKIDGSLIKVWNYNGDWKISTSGLIDAKDAKLPKVITDVIINTPINNFHDLFMQAVDNVKLDISKLNPNYTYMFELTSPYNRVIIPYEDITIHHIGTRDNLTLKELDIDIGVEKPKQYNCNTLDNCITMANDLPFDEEGYVVVDKDWHRIKVKSPAYISAHYIIGSGTITEHKILKIISNNEFGELFTYFPELKKYFDEEYKKIDNLGNFVFNIVRELKKNKYSDRMELVNDINNLNLPKHIAPVVFNIYDYGESNLNYYMFTKCNLSLLETILNTDLYKKEVN